MTVPAKLTRYQSITRLCLTSAGTSQTDRVIPGTIPALRAEQRVFPVTEPADKPDESTDKPEFRSSYGTFGGLCVREPGAVAFVIADV